MNQNKSKPQKGNRFSISNGCIFFMIPNECFCHNRQKSLQNNTKDSKEKNNCLVVSHKPKLMNQNLNVLILFFLRLKQVHTRLLRAALSQVQQKLKWQLKFISKWDFFFNFSIIIYQLDLIFAVVKTLYKKVQISNIFLFISNGKKITFSKGYFMS